MKSAPRVFLNITGLAARAKALRVCLVALKADLHPEPSWPELQERCQHNPRITMNLDHMLTFSSIHSGIEALICLGVLVYCARSLFKNRK